MQASAPWLRPLKVVAGSLLAITVLRALTLVRMTPGSLSLTTQSELHAVPMEFIVDSSVESELAPLEQGAARLASFSLPVDTSDEEEEATCGSTRLRWVWSPIQWHYLGRPFKCREALAAVERIALARSSAPRSSSIAIVTVASGYGRATASIARNRNEYAKLHSYTAVLVESEGQGRQAVVSGATLRLADDWDSLGFAWGKLRVVEAVFEQMPHITHVFWIDADMVLTNLRVGLEWIALLGFSFVACADENGINTGAFMARNDAFSRNLLRRAWGLAPYFAAEPYFEQGALIGVAMSELSSLGSTGMSAVEQGRVAVQAFHDSSVLGDTPACARQLNRLTPVSSRGKVWWLPQCIFGSRLDSWTPGAFLVHFAGLDLEHKIRLFVEFERKVLRDLSLVKTVQLPDST